MTREVDIDERLHLTTVIVPAVLDQISKYFLEGVLVGILVRLDLLSLEVDMLKSLLDNLEVLNCRWHISKALLAFFLSERAIVRNAYTNGYLLGSLKAATWSQVLG
jgi:hypothetical protein